MAYNIAFAFRLGEEKAYNRRISIEKETKGACKREDNDKTADLEVSIDE
jgi:hypothetical protein